MKDKQNQNFQLATEGYEPKTELPKNYTLPSSLQNAFFKQSNDNRQVSRNQDSINIKQTQKTMGND